MNILHLVAHLIIGLLTSLCCGYMYRLGGDGSIPFLWIPGFNAKLWRTLGIGGLIGIVYTLLDIVHNGFQWIDLLPLSCLGSYFFPGIFPYGEKSWLNFLGERGKYAVSGFAFGLSGLPAMGYISCLQAIISAIAYVVIRELDERNIIKNPWVERLRGFFGTICLIFK